MGTIKRAYLYVTRKKGKSILLFFILLIMATFVLTGLSIEKVSQAEQKNLREALGGEFHITVELSESNPYFREMNDGEGNVELWTEFPITQDVINAVMSTDGIKSYDAETKTFVSTDLDVFPGNVPMKAEFNNLVYARTVADTENSSFFQSGIAKLIEGNHITGNESNVAVISKDLADANSLGLGSFVSLQADRTVDVKVIGIYQILTPDSPLANIVTYEKAENQIFTDMNTLQDLFGDKPVGFDSAAFTVYDPAQLDSIISEVNSLSSVDWRAFTLTTNDQTYLDAAAPLQNLQSLMSSIIWGIALVSAVILSLILTMWGRSRIYETGILLSLGIGKIKIIGQYLAEVLMVAVIALGCSYFTSSAFAGQFANGLLQQNIPAGEEQAAGVDITRKDGYGDDVVVSIKDDSVLPSGQDAAPEAEVLTDGTKADTEQIRVTIEPYNMLQLYFIGITVIILSVGVSSLSVMRLKPREILSKMS